MQTKISQYLINGIKTHIIEIPTLDLTYAQVVYRRGVIYDEPNKLGLAHFFEHIWGTKTKYWQNDLEKSLYIEKKGIIKNAYTERLLVYHYGKQDSSNLIESIQIIDELVKNGEINQDDFISEKKVVIQEKEDSKYDEYDKKIELIYIGNSLSQNVFGNVEDIELQDVLDFNKQYFSLENANMVILTPDIEIIKNSELKIEPTLIKPIPLEDEFFNWEKNIDNAIEFNLVSIDTENVNVSLNFIYKNSLSQKEIWTLYLLRNIIANYWSSYLIKRLRLQERLVYWVDSYIDDNPQASNFSIEYKVSKENLEKTLDILQDMLANLEFDNEILDQIKNLFLIDSKIYYSSINNLAEFYRDQLRNNLVIEYKVEDYWNFVKITTVEDLDNIVKKVLSPRNKMLLINGKLTKYSCKSNNLRYN